MNWLTGIAAFALAVAGAVFCAFFWGRSKGKASEREREHEAVIESVKKANKAASEVERLPDGDVIKRLLDKWGR